MIEILRNWEEIEGNILKLINGVYKKNPTTNIIPYGEILDILPLRMGPRKEFSVSPLLFNIMMVVLENVIRQGNKS